MTKQEGIVDLILRTAGALWLDAVVPELSFSIEIRGTADGEKPVPSAAREVQDYLELRIPDLQRHIPMVKIEGPSYQIHYHGVPPWDRMSVKRIARRELSGIEVRVSPDVYMGPF